MDKAASPLVTELLSYKSQDVSSFPLRLKLVQVIGRDLGHAGLWNQYEFCKAMIKISASWTVREVLYHQSSLSDHVATAFAESLDGKISGAKAKAEPRRPAEASDGGLDWSIFEDPLLLPGFSSSSKAAEPMSKEPKTTSKTKTKIHDDHEGLSEVSELSACEEDGWEAAEHDGRGYGAMGASASSEESEKELAMKPRDLVKGVQAFQESKTGKDRAARTDATDFDLVTRALQPRPPTPILTSPVLTFLKAFPSPHEIMKLRVQESLSFKLLFHLLASVARHLRVAFSLG